MKKVLFVCLGNICRSPLAEAIFADLIIKKGLENDIQVDSCGTAAYYVGDNPDPRTIQVAGDHNIAISHRGRQLSQSDFAEFDFIVGMDKSNYQNIESVNPTGSRIYLMRDFDTVGKGLDVPDPYYGGDEGFEEVYQILVRSSPQLLKFVQDNQKSTFIKAR